MKIHFINLDQRTDRRRQFLLTNKHLTGLSRFSAIDGRGLDAAALVREGVIAKGIPSTYSTADIGLALSHITLWKKAVETETVVTICEDDAIFSFQFLDTAERIISRLPTDWDLVMWGWNFDSALMMDILPGVSPCAVVCDQDQMRIAVGEFQKISLAPQSVRLLQAFGTICYSISPKGARVFINLCYPIPELSVFFPALNRALPNYAIDVMMSNAYPRTKSFVSFPPLVITRNERARSS